MQWYYESQVWKMWYQSMFHSCIKLFQNILQWVEDFTAIMCLLKQYILKIQSRNNYGVIRKPNNVLVYHYFFLSL